MRHFFLEEELTSAKTEVSLVTSPVTTPTTLIEINEEKCLFRKPAAERKKKLQIFTSNKEKIWKYCVQNTPYLILITSLTEAIFFVKSDSHIRQLLRFEPKKKHQIWRYLTYMFVHEDYVHLVLNLILQCIFASFLETKQGRFRVAIVYFAGGITGVLGASCINPGLLIGASAGVYAILISLVADLYLNYENTRYKIYRSICIAVIVSSDIFFNLHHNLSRTEPLISWEAHIFGGLTGLILGLVLYKNVDGLQQERKNICLTFGSLLYVVLFTSLVIMTIDSEASSSIAAKKV